MNRPSVQTRSSGRPGQPAWNSQLIFLVLATGIFAGAVSMRILDSLLPLIASYYGHSVGEAGAAVTAYALSYSGLQIFYGPLGDRLGPFRIIAVAALCSGIAALGCALAPSLGWLVGLRLVAGAIGAAIGPLTLAWISLVTDAERRPVAIANMTGASIIGTTAGQIGGGLFGSIGSWQASFVVIGALFLAAGAFMMCAGRFSPELYAVGRRSADVSGPPGMSLAALLRLHAVQAVLVPVFIEGFAMFMSFTYVSAFIKDTLSLGMSAIGVLVAFFGVGGVAFVLIARPVVKRVGEGSRALMGGCLMAAGYAGLMLVPPAPVMAALIFLLGLGFMMLHNVLQVRASHMVPDAPGASISLFASTFFIAQAIGAFVGGWTFDRFGAPVLFAVSAILLSGTGMALRWRAGPVPKAS